MAGFNRWRPSGANLYVVENHPGALYRVAIAAGGAAGAVTQITTQRPVFGPDGLKVINPPTLAIAEDSGGMAIGPTATKPFRLVETPLAP